MQSIALVKMTIADCLFCSLCPKIHYVEGTRNHSVASTRNHSVEGTRNHSVAGTRNHSVEGTRNHSVEGTHLDAFNHCHNMCFLVVKQFLSRAIIGPITF